MSLQTLLALMAVGVLFMAWYANSSKRDKILCTFRRVNKTKITKFVKMSDTYVIFDKHKYDVITSRIDMLWYTGGLIHMIFPQWVATLDFTYWSRWPLDPKTRTYSADTPTSREAINKQEWVESYFKGAKPSSTKKGSMISQYLPWIAIIGVVLVGFYFYMNMQGLSNHMKALENAINAITK